MDKIKVKLYESDSYFAYWQGVRPAHRTSEEAWQEVEDAAEKMYGTRIFQTYDAFRTALHYYAKNNPIPTPPESMTHNLLTNIGYWERYFTIVQDNQTLTPGEAYLTIEGEVRKNFNFNVYTTFEAFSKALARYIKNRKHLQEKGLIKLNIKRS